MNSRLANVSILIQTLGFFFFFQIMAIAFDKLKEKKAVLRNELIELCDAAALTVGRDAV